MNFFQPLETFFRNIRDSFRYSLKGIYNKTKILDKPRLDDDLLLESILYAIPNSGIKRPKILTADETINEILTTSKNIVRYGDGEILAMDGHSITFQKTDTRLVRRLKGIFANPHPNLLIGINRRYYYPNPMNEIIHQSNIIYKHFELCAVPQIRKKLTKYLNYDITYYEAGITGGGSLPNLARVF